MSYKKLVLGVLCSTLVAVSAMAEDPIIVFDFEDQNPTPSWLAEFDTTVSNYTLSGTGRLDAVKRPPGPIEWEGSFCFLYGDGGFPGPGYITLYDEVLLVNRWFVLSSLNASSQYTNAPYTTVKGFLEGEEQWEIIIDGGEVVSNSPTSAIWPNYTTADSGSLTLPIDELVWEAPGGLWADRMDSITVQAVPAVPTQIKLFAWDLDTHWTPHTVWHSDFDFLGGTQPYWWSGYTTTNDPKVILHQPGIPNLPADGGYDDIPGDIYCGGAGFAGIYFNREIPELEVGEIIDVEFETKLYISGTNYHRLVDVYIDPNATTNSAQYFGAMGTDTTENELGFGLIQTAASNIVVYVDPSDPLLLDPFTPLFQIPLEDIGIPDSAITNGAGSHLLTVKYSATKTSIPDTWECDLSISNTVTTDEWVTNSMPIVNAATYDTVQYLCVSTADNLSTNYAHPATVDMAGYEVDQFYAYVFLNQDVASGYNLYVESYGLAIGAADTGPYEDYDDDGLLNIYEYGWRGNMTNETVGPAVLPYMTVSNGVAYYSSVQLKDTQSGINYDMQTSTNLYTGFSSVGSGWDVALPPESVDEYLNRYTGGLNLDDAQFFKTVITTNTP